MAKIPGTAVASPIVPLDSGLPTPTHVDTYGKGGWVTVASLAERNAIPPERRKPGMVAAVADAPGSTPWELATDLTTWTPFRPPSFPNAELFTNTSLAIAGTTAGDWFYVADETGKSLYRNVAGVATFVILEASAAQLTEATEATAGNAQLAIEAKEAAETAANRIDLGVLDAAVASTAEDAAQTLADRNQTGLDRAATAADRSQTALDVLQTGARATQAEAARDAAFINALVYEETAEGLAETLEGEQFQIVDADGLEVIRYRHDPGPTATPVAKYPTVVSVSNISARADRLEISLSSYTGDDDLIPLYTDAVGKVLIGVYKTTGKVFVSGAFDEQGFRDALGAFGKAVYVGSGPIYPIITDIVGRVVFGVDSDSGTLVGSGISGDANTLNSDPDDLPEPIEPTSVNHFLFYGQSLSVGAAAGSLVSTTQPYSNITFSGGPRAWDGENWDFSSFKPLVEDEVSPSPDGSGNRKETPCSGAANYASTKMALRGIAPSDHVILASTAGRGGSRIDQLNKASSWYSNLLAHISAAHALNSSHAVQALGWLQGENDVIAATSFSAYRDELAALQSDIENDGKGITGQAHPIYLLTYQVSYGIKLNPGVALAQLDLSQKHAKIYMTTPTYHLPHAGDNVHLTAVGYKWIGAYFGRAYDSLLRGKAPQFLNPVSATIRGSVIRVRFDVPTDPMILDVATLPPTEDYGFVVMDDDNVSPIADIGIDGRDVVITLSSEPEGITTVRYAMDNLSAELSIANAASGNLRDSSKDVATVAGIDRPLWNVAPAFSLTAIALRE